MHVKDIKPTTKANFELRRDPTEVGSGMRRLEEAAARRLRRRNPRLLLRAGAAVRHARLESAKISYDYLAKVRRLMPLRMAMVGGGPGSFIGPVHRMAAELDGRIRLVAGGVQPRPGQERPGGRRLGRGARPGLSATITR